MKFSRKSLSLTHMSLSLSRCVASMPGPVEMFCLCWLLLISSAASVGARSYRCADGGSELRKVFDQYGPLCDGKRWAKKLR